VGPLRYRLGEITLLAHGLPDHKSSWRRWRCEKS